MAKSPVVVPDRVAGSEQPMRLEIQPAVTASLGGERLPLRFTIRNTGDQVIHTCLSGGHVIHLWDDRKYGYTLAQQRSDQPGCEEPFDLQPHGERSWTEEITIPAVAAGPARIVGFTQIVPPEPCDRSDCGPVWLSASFAPFQIEKGDTPAEPMDLRTGLTSTELTMQSLPVGSEREQ